MNGMKADEYPVAKLEEGASLTLDDGIASGPPQVSSSCYEYVEGSDDCPYIVPSVMC